MQIKITILATLLLVLAVSQSTIKNCVEENKYGYCQICEFNYLPSLLKKQQSCVYKEGCDLINDYDVCKSCRDGYIRDNETQTCNKEINNCLIQTGNMCGECEIGYLPSRKDQFKSCVKRPNCSYINEKDVCEKCERGYYYEQKTQTCEIQIKYCTKQSYEICLECQNYYLPSKLDNLKSCVKIFGCINIDDFNKCQKCQTGLILNNQTCLLPVKKCSSYDTSNKCSSCENGFKLVGQMCEETELPIENCKKQNLNECIECFEGFLPSKLNHQKICVYRFGCEFITEDDICKACQKGLVYQSKTQTCEKLIENCVSYGEDFKCHECEVDYLPSKVQFYKACVKREGCSYINEADTCKGCNKGYKYDLKTFSCLN